MATANVDVQAPIAAMAGRGRLEAGARAVVFHLVWVVPCVAVYVWFLGAHFQGLRLPDAMDAAQVGRHVSEGHGFTTSVVRPFSLVKAPRVAGHPDLYNAPVYPLLLGIAFNLFGANDRTVVLLSLVLSLLTVVLAYLIAARLAGRYAGALSALLVGLHPGLLKATYTGLNVAVFAFLFALLFYLVLRHPGTARWSVLCGVVFGLMYLTDYVAAALVVPVGALVYLAQREGRLRHLGLFLAGTLATVTPWLVRNRLVAGSPFANLKSYWLAMNTGSYPVTSLYRHTSSGLDKALPVTFVVGHYREVAKKLLLNLNGTETTLPALLGLCLLPLLGLALFTDLRSPAGNRLKWGLLGGIVLVSLSLALGQSLYDVLYGMVAVIGALGAAAFVLVFRQRRLSPGSVRAATAALVCLALLPIGLLAVPGTRADKPDTQNWEYLGRVLPENAVVMTDQPWAVAWYANRSAVWIPQAMPPEPDPKHPISWAEAVDATRSKGFSALKALGVEPDAIFLSAQLSAWPAEEGEVQWQWLQAYIAQRLDLLQRDENAAPPWPLPGWTLAATLPPGDFLLVRSEEAAGASGPSAAAPGSQDSGATETNGSKETE